MSVTSASTPPTSTRASEQRTALSIKGLTKSYPPQGGVGPVTAVDHVDLEIEPGELFFLLGPSGCGKTTLLRMIAGFVEPTSGSINFRRGSDNKDVTYLEPNKRNTGMVFQSYALWPHMSVAENVGFGLDVRSVKGDERSTRIMKALQTVQMEQYAARKPIQLSGGQQQRVALARAIVINPSVLLLDEPLSNLDAKLRLELRLEIRKVCKSLGMTAIYVTHDQKEALSMADRMAVLRAGRVEAVGTPAALYQTPHTRFVAEFMGETNFIPVKNVHQEAQEWVFDTPVGILRSTIAPPTGKICLSVRPEAVSIGGSLMFHVEQAVFLGDAAQLVLKSDSGLGLKISLSNPKQLPEIGSVVGVSIPPHSVVPVAE